MGESALEARVKERAEEARGGGKGRRRGGGKRSRQGKEERDEEGRGGEGRGWRRGRGRGRVVFMSSVCPCMASHGITGGGHNEIGGGGGKGGGNGGRLWVQPQRRDVAALEQLAGRGKM
jgi:hypothetical protein